MKIFFVAFFVLSSCVQRLESKHTEEIDCDYSNDAGIARCRMPGGTVCYMTKSYDISCVKESE